ncbi:metallophosphoesterase [Candidatus Omnitrophota bacterium]
MAIIAMSDLHLGEESSVANPDLASILVSLYKEDIPDFYSCLKKRLNSEIKEVNNQTPSHINQKLQRINDESGISHVILMGDILDLSVASYHDAAYQARLFLSRMLEGIVPEHIILIPGNHDHHLWSQVSEEQWIESALKQNKLWDEPFSRITKPTDSLKPNEPGVQFIKGFFPENCQNNIEVAYPNYTTLGPDGWSYVFDHGHLFDYAQSWIGQWGPGKIIDVNNLEDLERVNSPWLEMVWYGFGQGGPLALDSENLFEESVRFIEKVKIAKNILLLKNATTSAKEASKKILNLGKKIWGRLSRGKSRKVSTPANRGKITAQGEMELKENLLNYLNEFITVNNGYPELSTFVYGHTHSWCDRKNYKKRRILNTGGWTADERDVPTSDKKIQTRILVIDNNGHKLEPIGIDKDVQHFCWAMNQALTDSVISLGNKI